MADLEQLAIKRDRKFLVRLVLALAAGVVVGLILYAQLTSASTGSCAAGMFGTVAPTEPASPPASR